jgi:hypothetical protein
MNSTIANPSFRTENPSKRLRYTTLLAAIFGLLAMVAAVSNAQGVGISESSISPHGSAILELKYTSGGYKGFLVPRMTTANRNTIATPATGLIIYNTDDNQLNFYNGSGWTSYYSLSSITSGGIPYFNSASSMASSSALTANALMIGGGAGTAPATLGSLGTTTTVLHGNAAGAPTFGQIVNADITDGTIDLTAKVTGTLPEANGGTGQSSYTIGDMLFASGATTLSKLLGVSAGSYLRSGGVATAPSWSTLKLPDAATTGDIFYASGVNTMGNLAGVAVGQVLVSGGVGTAPSYSATPSLGVAGATLGTLSMSGNTSGTITIQPQAAAGTYNFNLPTDAGTTGQFLTSEAGGASPMTWTSLGGMTSITANVSITGGTAQVQVISFTIPANTLLVGSTFRIRASGTGGSNASANTFRVRIGTTTLTGNIAATLATTGTAAASIPFSIDAIATIRSIGATGSALGSISLNNNTSTGIANKASAVGQTTATVVVNTTVQNIIELTFQPANAATNVVIYNAVIEIVKP